MSFRRFRPAAACIVAVLAEQKAVLLQVPAKAASAVYNEVMPSLRPAQGLVNNQREHLAHQQQKSYQHSLLAMCGDFVTDKTPASQSHAEAMV